MPDKETAALVVERLTVNYDRISVLWDINFSVPQKKLVALIGPNGAGKSTLMKAILGLVKPLNGQIKILGSRDRNQLKKIAYIPQRESIDWDFPITVGELVMQGRYAMLGLFRWIRKADKEAVLEVLKLVGMEDYLDRQISQLSIGQQQRIFLARALLLDADIYFMDEPFSGVDSITETFIFDFLEKIKKQGKTIVVIHHDVKKIETHFDWVVMLNMRLITCGPVSKCFNAKNFKLTFGQNTTLFEEAFNLSQNKIQGTNY